MTHAIDNADILRRLKAGQRVTAIAAELGVSSQVITYRLRKAGVSNKNRKNPISPRRIRALRDNFGTLEDLLAFLEETREALLSRMGDNPGSKTLDRLGKLTDYINVMQEISG